MPVTYLIKFDVNPDQVELFGMLPGGLDAMRGEPTFHEAMLQRDPESQDRFMLYETWESHEDVMAVQLQRPYRKAWHDALPALLRQPRDVAVWQPIRADRNPTTHRS
jgi:quinol monooxygenase YgiN